MSSTVGRSYQYIGGRSILWRDTISTMERNHSVLCRIFSTMEGNKKRFRYPSTLMMISPTILNTIYITSKHLSTLLNTIYITSKIPQHYFKISPHFSEHHIHHLKKSLHITEIPSTSLQDIPQITEYPPHYFKISPHFSEHPIHYFKISPKLLTTLEYTGARYRWSRGFYSTARRH